MVDGDVAGVVGVPGRLDSLPVVFHVVFPGRAGGRQRSVGCRGRWIGDAGDEVVPAGLPGPVLWEVQGQPAGRAGDPTGNLNQLAPPVAVVARASSGAAVGAVRVAVAGRFAGRFAGIRSTAVVVDDVWSPIGAAHWRRHGMTFDGSVPVASVDRQLAGGVSVKVRAGAA